MSGAERGASAERSVRNIVGARSGFLSKGRSDRSVSLLFRSNTAHTCRGILNVSERGAISPERDEIVGERVAELRGAVCCDFERWSGGAKTHVSGEREFSPLSSAHML